MLCSPPPAVLLVIDLCCAADELDHLKSALLELLSSIPEHVLVGLVSYDAMVQVHDIGAHEVPRAYLLRGDRETTADQVGSVSLALDGALIVCST